MDSSTIIMIAVAVVGVYLFIKLIKVPLKLLLHAVSGFLLLIAAEFVCGFFDFSLGINLIKCIVAGILGIPGVIALVLLKIFVGI